MHKCRHSHTHTHNINFHQSESLPWNDRATSIFNSSLTSSKRLLAEHKHKIVTRREEKTDVDLCAGFESAFLMVTSYNYRAASRLNKPHNQDIREASQDWDISRTREDEQLGVSHLARATYAGEADSEALPLHPRFSLSCLLSRGHTYALVCKNPHVKLLASLRGYWKLRR